MKKKETKIFIILFICNFLFLASCQTDNLDSDHEYGEKIITNSIDFDTFKNKFDLNQGGKLFEKFDIISGTQLQQRTASGNFISIIHTDEISYFELENGMTTYTFRATTNIENDTAITNVVYYTQGGTAFDFKVIRYIPDEGWLNNYKNGIYNEYLGELEGYSSIEINLDHVILNRGNTKPCMLSLPIWRCAAGNAHSLNDHLDGTCLVGGNYIVGYNTVWGDCPTPGEGTGGGGGSGGTNPNPGGEIIVVPTKPLVLVTPCKELSELVNPEKANIKPNIDFLKEKVNSINNDKEYGVSVHKKMNPDETYSYINTNVESTQEFSVNLPTSGGHIGGAHSHPKKGVAMFSFGDVRFLRNAYQAASTSRKPEVFSILVCKNEEGEVNVYALKVDDYFKLNMHVDAIWNKSDYNQINGVSDRLDAIHTDQGMIYSSNNQLEKSFLQQFSLYGISLYKATDNSLANWNKLELSSTAPLTVVPKPCN